MDSNGIIDILKLVWPVLVIQLGLQIYAIIDIIRRKKTRNLNPALWLVIVLVGGILGPILYLLIGRSEE